MRLRRRSDHALRIKADVIRPDVIRPDVVRTDVVGPRVIGHVRSDILRSVPCARACVDRPCESKSRSTCRIAVRAGSNDARWYRGRGTCRSRRNSREPPAATAVSVSPNSRADFAQTTCRETPRPSPATGRLAPPLREARVAFAACCAAPVGKPEPLFFVASRRRGATIEAACRAVKRGAAVHRSARSGLPNAWPVRSLALRPAD